MLINNNIIQATNEPVLSYAPGSLERTALLSELHDMESNILEIPAIISGKAVTSTQCIELRAPHAHNKILANVHNVEQAIVKDAITTACKVQKEWSSWTLEERGAVFLKAADLLAGPWRARLNAATMLGQSKTIQQSEIDAACELIDFLRFNVQFAQEIAATQPLSSNGVRNRLDYRPLEGFVYAVTPFNFTAIGGNLATAPALMGNCIVWKPAATATLSNYLFMELLKEAGLPDGVINFIPGDAPTITKLALAHKELAGIHFTGSTAIFDELYGTVGKNISYYNAYPRLVGETGGKDFVLAHNSADVKSLAIALIRGAFEYQGQKCSAASRAYVPSSIWPQLKDVLIAQMETIKVGDVTDFTNFMGAVIDKKAYNRIVSHLTKAQNDHEAKIIAGGKTSDEFGYFIEPTVIQVTTPTHSLMQTEIFGPVLAIYVYDDAHWDDVLKLVDETSPYALTGAIFAHDRRAIAQASGALRFAAGNFYINDKPTGAVVGQQPFGGARRSGTNDKAGSSLNLLRWVSPRTIKETAIPSMKYSYPHME